MSQETVSAPGEPTAVTGLFRTLFPTTPHGAHTARHAAERWVAAQQGRSEAPTDDGSAATAALLIAELAANATQHGRYGQERAPDLTLVAPTTLRIEVTDARGDRLPDPVPDTDRSPALP